MFFDSFDKGLVLAKPNLAKQKLSSHIPSQPSPMASDTDIPGLDQPLSYEPELSELLPNLLLDNDRGSDRSILSEEPSTNQLPLTTLREFTMLHIMNAVTDKPDWNTKVRVISIFCNHGLFISVSLSDLR